MTDSQIPGWRKVETCPVCNSTNRVLNSSANGNPSAIIDVGGMCFPVVCAVAYWRCYDCGLVYHVDTPTAETLETFYAGGVYRSITSRGGDEIRFERDRATRIVGVLAQKSLYPFVVLDIGCGAGEFLSLCADTFYSKIMGVDPLGDYVQRSIPRVDTIADVTGVYDLVSMLHVLEHTIDPLALLRQAREFVSPGGHLLVEVPSIFPGGNPVAHCLYIDPWVLVNMLKMTGYAIRHTIVTNATTTIIATVDNG